MLWWFAETTLVATILACAAALFGRLPRMGPSGRHVLWLVVLIKLVTPPMIKAPWTVSPPGSWRPARNDRAVSETNSPRDALPPPSEPALDVTAPGAGEDSGPDLAPVPVTIGASGTAQRADTIATEPQTTGTIRQCLLAAWVSGSVAVGLTQLLRIVRFRRRLTDAVPAPEWLAGEAKKMGVRLGIRVPELLVGPHLMTPVLWCLGQPKLLVPCRLVRAIEAARWRGILAHELAHLCRGDHWVCRLELIAGLIWWWNPLYWLTRRRLEAEAELACDAWVVWALPDERMTYAEVLFQVCSAFSRATFAAPALGVAGSGRFFERRLTMILRDHVSCRVSPLTLLAACLLALLALPSWTVGKGVALAVPDPEPSSAIKQAADDPPASQVAEDDGDHDNDADDDQKSADKEKAARKDPARVKSKDRHEKNELDIDVELSDLETKIEKALGPDFEKRIEAWAEKFAREMEQKFGEHSQFVKKMEALGKQMEREFGDGSEFAKKMEALGKDMEKKFGPGSDFEKSIKQKFGPGSDFEKKMKAMATEMEKKFGPGSDFEKKVKEKVDREVARAKSKAENKPSKENELKAEKSHPRNQRREERIKALEARIDALMKELKALKDADQHEDDDDGK